MPDLTNGPNTSYAFTLRVPEEIGWNVPAWIFGDEIAQEAREFSNDVERWENEGGPCVP